MTPTTQQLSDQYYQAFRTGSDFSEVAMAPSLAFTGPMHHYEDGERYRTDCAQLAGNLASLDIKQQYIDGDRAHTVFEFDLGLPTGPVSSAETLTFKDGQLVAAELIFDSAPVREARP